MKELPKELTSELLGLVLGEKVIKIMPNSVEVIEYCYLQRGISSYTTINPDTITRLMKEWIVNEGYWITVGYSKIYQVIITSNGESILDEQLFRADCQSELKAIAEATEWVAKEKGLPC